MNESITLINTTCLAAPNSGNLLVMSIFWLALFTPVLDAQSLSSRSGLQDNTDSITGEVQVIPHSVPSLPAVAASAQTQTVQRPESHVALEQLFELEKRVQAIIPNVQQCVVSVEGGCGFVINETGLVITVSHVSKKAGRQVIVKFADGRTRQALTLGSNRANDTGALQLLGMGPWKHLEFANPSETTIGQWCLAFGYPIEFNRNSDSVVRIGQVTKVSTERIVSDCLIMGGDSGGPLVNLEGKVIAINSGVTTSLKQNLHVPASVFKDDRQNILAGLDLTRPQSAIQKIYFGVLGETDHDRVRIRQVFRGSPAAVAGIEKDDVILSLNGESLESFSEFLNLLDQHAPGDSVFARVNRFGQVLNVVVQLKQR